MGNCDCDKNNLQNIETENSNRIKISDFTKLYPIGKGSAHKVWKVELNKENITQELDNKLLKSKTSIFAMKEFSKEKIYIKK